MANNWKKTIMFGERKVNPLLTISGGLLGLVAAVAVFYFFAVYIWYGHISRMAG